MDDQKWTLAILVAIVAGMALGTMLARGDEKKSRAVPVIVFNPNGDPVEFGSQPLIQTDIK